MTGYFLKTPNGCRIELSIEGTNEKFLRLKTLGADGFEIETDIINHQDAEDLADKLRSFAWKIADANTPKEKPALELKAKEV